MLAVLEKYLMASYVKNSATGREVDKAFVKDLLTENWAPTRENLLGPGIHSVVKK